MERRLQRAGEKWESVREFIVEHDQRGEDASEKFPLLSDEDLATVDDRLVDLCWELEEAVAQITDIAWDLGFEEDAKAFGADPGGPFNPDRLQRRNRPWWESSRKTWKKNQPD